MMARRGSSGVVSSLFSASVPRGRVVQNDIGEGAADIGAGEEPHHNPYSSRPCAPRFGPPPDRPARQRGHARAGRRSRRRRDSAPATGHRACIAASALQRKAALAPVPHHARRRPGAAAQHPKRGMLHAFHQQRQSGGFSRWSVPPPHPARARRGTARRRRNPSPAPCARCAAATSASMISIEPQITLDGKHVADSPSRSRSRAHAAIDEQDRAIAPPVLPPAGDHHAQGWRAAGLGHDPFPSTGASAL